MRRERLRNLTAPHNVQATDDIHAIAKHYPNFTKIYIPNKPIQRLSPGFEHRPTKTKKLGLGKSEDIERSLRRTQNKIRDYTLCNDFDLFITLTTDPEKVDRHNEELVKQKLKDWLKNQRNRNGKFRYILIPERHKSGALHFHALFGDFSGTVAPSINPKTNKQITKKGRKAYNLPSYTLGFSEVYKIDKNADSQERVANYIRKYITKDMPIIFNKRRYWASTGLKTPKHEYNPQPWYKTVTPHKEYENDYGTFLEFRPGHPLVDMFRKASMS